ncbi:acyltransferase family protein [Micromonospora sp. IBSANI012]|uniref:acyltransferase family protein n=1 Tax=Micromonospora sp. IBSANI012 TaxID=3457761 RepID=UPI004059F4F1
MRTPWAGRRLPTLEERFSSRHNALGLIRLVLASAVLVAHAWPLGIGQPEPGRLESSGQTDLGVMSVYGFFVLSGFLITGSGLKFSVGRYAWHRVLRIFPGFWVCLVVTALAIAPLVALYEKGSLQGFWNHAEGPFDYIAANWFASMQQYQISGLLAEGPYGQSFGGKPTAFDGSLWSLKYELACYVLVAALMATRVLRNAPRTVLLLAAICFAFIVADLINAPTWTSHPPGRGSLGPFPLLGSFVNRHMIYLGFLFLLGAAARLYRHRMPMHGALAALAGVALALSMWLGGFYVIGLPAYAYLLLYLAVALPGPLRRIGRERDYSYGIYIYGFPVQQAIALVGGARYGVAVYLLLSALGTLALAVPSWHLIERPAMSHKDRTLPIREWSRRWRGRTVERPDIDGPTVPLMRLPAPRPKSDQAAMTTAGTDGADARGKAA